MPARVSTATVILVTGLSLAGCGSASHASSGTAGGPSQTATGMASSSAPRSADQRAALRRAVQAYSDAYLTGKPSAYGMLSARCRVRMGRSHFAGMLAAAKNLYGNALPMKSFSAKISGDMARVTYTYAVSAIDQTAEPWVREGGSWHEDDC